MINMRRLMFDRDFRVMFTVKRPTLATAHVGEVALSYDETDLFGVVQPPSPEDTRLLPEGTRVTAVRVFWTTEELRAGDGQNFESDVLIYKEQSYRVLRASPRDENGFYRVVAEGFNPTP